MINTRAERRAVHEVAAEFTKNNWVFRENNTTDFGIDAFVEASTGGRPDGRFLAVQIKGSEKGFYHSKKDLIFYFSDSHRSYWKSVSESMPVLLFLQDSHANEIFWQQITDESIQQTNKKWKLKIPYSNKLDKEAFEYLRDLAHNYPQNRPFRFYVNERPQVENRRPDSLNVEFSLGKGRLKELLCTISNAEQYLTKGLGYNPGKNWNSNKGNLSWNDPYYFTMLQLEENLVAEYNDLKNGECLDIVGVLGEKIEQLLKIDGIRGLARNLFDKQNLLLGVPEFDRFVEAFEYYANLEPDKYAAQPVGHTVYFRTNSREYEMETYEGKTALLKSFIERRSYDEIFTETNMSIWSEIYLDAGIEKEKFIPHMLREWELYWDQLYVEINKSIGVTSHLDDGKIRSWRQMQAFMEGYNDAGDAIEFAWSFDEAVLYPISVITMMNIFDPEVCYEEYCELEFWSGNFGWDDVRVGEDEQCPIFHIRLAEI